MASIDNRNGHCTNLVVTNISSQMQTNSLSAIKPNSTIQVESHVTLASGQSLTTDKSTIGTLRVDEIRSATSNAPIVINGDVQCNDSLLCVHARFLGNLSINSNMYLAYSVISIPGDSVIRDSGTVPLVLLYPGLKSKFQLLSSRLEGQNQRVLRIKNIHPTNTVTLGADGSDSIDRQNLMLLASDASVTLVCVYDQGWYTI